LRLDPFGVMTRDLLPVSRRGCLLLPFPLPPLGPFLPSDLLTLSPSFFAASRCAYTWARRCGGHSSGKFRRANSPKTSTALRSYARTASPGPPRDTSHYKPRSPAAASTASERSTWPSWS